MKSTASLHAILSGRKPTDNVTVPEVELRDELDEYNDIPQVANKELIHFAGGGSIRFSFQD